ncbi:ABC transporter ATP-binding protein [Candidatus Saccharibacteria bacterium]|nr:ABC transporter ATP-binding protein [Candidatus Saccharibacteria bacterium]
MTNIQDDKIEEFLSLFSGDASEASSVLFKYAARHKESIASTGNLHNKSDLEEIISVEGVSKRYKLGKNTIDALKDVTFSIGKGEFVAITGASGSGKSTLLQIIGCLEKPSQGIVRVESKETTNLGDNALSDLRQNAIGFIFQSFYLQPFLRLKDNLTVPAMFTTKNKKEIDSEVERLLEQVGLSERANHFPKELSGGQIQRAAIARALINNPRIILADEPTGNLDSTNSKSIIELFRSIRDTYGTTIVVVTHDASIAREADRILELKDGAIV